MTKTGISKTVFFGILALEAIVDIATTDDGSSNRKFHYCCILAVLIIFYWFKQTFLEYTGDIRGKIKEGETEK